MSVDLQRDWLNRKFVLYLHCSERVSGRLGAGQVNPWLDLYLYW